MPALLLLLLVVVQMSGAIFNRPPARVAGAGFNRPLGTNSPGGGGSAPAYEILIDFEDLTAANGAVITRAILTNSTSYGLTNLSNSTNAWQVQSNGLPVVSSTRLVIDATVGVNPFRGTRCMRADATVDFTRVEFTLARSNAAMSFGFALMLDASWSGATFNSYDHFGVAATGGEFMVCNMSDGDFGNGGSPFEFGVHTLDGIGNRIITLDPEVWYWITMRWNQAGDAWMEVYVGASSGNLGTLVESRSILTLAAQYPQRVGFGRYDNHDVTNPGAFVYFDDITVDRDGVFPVVPP